MQPAWHAHALLMHEEEEEYAESAFQPSRTAITPHANRLDDWERDTASHVLNTGNEFPQLKFVSSGIYPSLRFGPPAPPTFP